MNVSLNVSFVREPTQANIVVSQRLINYCREERAVFDKEGVLLVLKVWSSSKALHFAMPMCGLLRKPSRNYVPYV